MKIQTIRLQDNERAVVTNITDKSIKVIFKDNDSFEFRIDLIKKIYDYYDNDILIIY